MHFQPGAWRWFQAWPWPLASWALALSRPTNSTTSPRQGCIKVGIFEDFPPFSSAGTDLKSQGYDIDVINALAKALNVTPELTGITGQNRIPSLTEHKLNLLVSVGVSDERKKVVAFTAPYAPYSIDVMGPKALAVKGPGRSGGQVGCGQSRHAGRHLGHRSGAGGHRHPALQRLQWRDLGVSVGTGAIDGGWQ